MTYSGTRYEYAVHTVDRTPADTADDIARQLTVLGGEGWQMVWTNPGLSAVIMMRAVPSSTGWPEPVRDKDGDDRRVPVRPSGTPVPAHADPVPYRRDSKSVPTD